MSSDKPIGPLASFEQHYSECSKCGSEFKLCPTGKRLLTVLIRSGNACPPWLREVYGRYHR